MSDFYNAQPEDGPRPPARESPSIVWPVLLIGAGLIFLLINLNLLPANSWQLVLRLWPLILILVGVELIFGRSSVLGRLVSTSLALVAVGGLLIFLLLAPRVPALSRLGGGGALRTENVQARLESGVETAQVFIDWGPGENTLVALPAGSDQLIEGQVQVQNSLNFSTNTSAGQTRVTLDTTGTIVWFSMENANPRWELGLNPQPIYDLKLDSGSGVEAVDLGQLKLSRLELDTASGTVNVALPAGAYTVDLDGGSGSVTLTIPPAVGVRAEVEAGSGSVSFSNAFQLVEGQPNEDSVWETPGYATASQQILLDIDGGSGSIRVNNQ